MKGIAYYSSPIGELLIESEGDAIVAINFYNGSKTKEQRTTTIDQCITALEEYFYKGRKFFSLELNPPGTEFQKKGWNELLTIPYGTTISYEALAIRIGNIKSIRAVGLAKDRKSVV